MSLQNLVCYTTPPQKGRRQKGEDKPSWQQGSSGRYQRYGREKQTDLFVILTGGGGFAAGGRGFAAGGGGCQGGLPRGGSKAGDTFSSEKTDFKLSTETLSC